MLVSDEEDERLNALLKRLSDFVDGWSSGDVVRVCAAVIVAAVAIAEKDKQDRDDMLEQAIDFMRATLAGIEAGNLDS